MRGLRCAALISAVLLAVLAKVEARAATNKATMQKIAEAVRRARFGETALDRSNAAERLPDLTESIDPNEIDDKTLADLISLLDTWQDSVRVPVPCPSGFLAPRAKSAVPKLLAMLPELDCEVGSW